MHKASLAFVRSAGEGSVLHNFAAANCGEYQTAFRESAVAPARLVPEVEVPGSLSEACPHAALQLDGSEISLT